MSRGAGAHELHQAHDQAHVAGDQPGGRCKRDKLTIDSANAAAEKAFGGARASNEIQLLDGDAAAMSGSREALLSRGPITMPPNGRIRRTVESDAELLTPPEIKKHGT